MAVQLFFSHSHKSYSYKDEKMLQIVRQQLILFEREGILVSHDFIGSRYCYNLVMKEAIARHERDEALVIPVILRPCLWQQTPIGKLQTLLKDGKPIKNLIKIDDATLNVESGILDSGEQNG